jgi:phosphate-selective porin OprO/OprP
MKLHSTSGKLTAVMMTLSALIFVAATVSWAAEPSVSEEILEILKDKGEISDQKYQELKDKAEAEKKEQGAWKTYWKSGLRVESQDGKFKSRWGGRIMLDWAIISADDEFEQQLEDVGESGPLEGTGVEFRRIRLFTDGLFYDTVGYKVDLDFAGAEVAFKDVYAQLVGVPFVGNIRVGHFREPFSLEELTSSNYITFMERSLPVLAFAPSRNTGIGIGNNVFQKRMRWDLGYFYEVGNDGEFFEDFNESQVTARVAGQPWYQDESHFLHLGVGYSHLFRDEDEDDASLRFRARPEAHITSTRLANTGNFSADAADKLNPELALVFGPFSLQGEYFWVNTDAGDVDDPTFTGWYASGSWFITGESRAYSQSSAKFSRVKPNNNFSFSEPGWGAFELAARFSTVDLTDSDIEGGQEQNFTGALNWYLNPNARIMFNYVYADLEDRADVDDDSANIFQVRFQVDF